MQSQSRYLNMSRYICTYLRKILKSLLEIKARRTGRVRIILKAYLTICGGGGSASIYVHTGLARKECKHY